MKMQAVRKRLITECVIALLLLGVLGGGMMALTSWHESSTRQRTSLNNQVQALINQVVVLREHYAKAQAVLPIYKKIMEADESQQVLDRKFVRTVLGDARDRFALSNVALEISPIEESKDPLFKKKSMVMVYTEIKLAIKALSDEDIFSTLRMLHQDLPGVVSIDRIHILRSEAPTNDVLLAISKEGTRGLVTCEASIRWMAMRRISVPETPAAPGALPARPGAP